MGFEQELRRQMVGVDEHGRDQEVLRGIDADESEKAGVRSRLGHMAMHVITSRSVGHDVQRAGETARRQRNALAERAARASIERDRRTAIKEFDDFTDRMGSVARRRNSGYDLG